ncbi:phospholipase C [Salinisphaera sp. LB1]|uniref:phospholipase C n=1 Tax=Salinisphaera sp. LB1 TaxID=2183911 RepID=UPI0018F4774B|nr:alkaline phosphatase family protein [Salinisphaera sp. LB1]
MNKKLAVGGAALATCLVATPVLAQHSRDHFEHEHSKRPGQTSQTITPIKHIVVIYQENVSFDHYFGTYPDATNPPGVPQFHAAADTPSVNGLNDYLLNHNPNQYNPARLSRSEPLTCDQDHGYTAEQKAFDGGLMDRFVENTNRSSCAAPEVGKPGLVMDYYDGNTVTAMWNYAQHFAMSDNSFGTTFGPSTPGALHLIAGQTYGGLSTQPDTDTYGVVNTNGQGVGTVINDPNPTFDDCSSSKYPTVSMQGQNVGNLLNDKGITWGWFEGGFRPTSTDSGKAVCGSQHTNVGGVQVTDYIPHHEPFQYYQSTSNPHHLPPTSVPMIGHDDQANHQYALADFWNAVNAGNMPAVSFLKAAGYQDGHAAYSDPLDEQHFLVQTINRLEQSPEWGSTAVIIAYDDSDGWYDHVMGPIVTQSNDQQYDALINDGTCTQPDGSSAGSIQQQDRCGYGPRLPLLVVSPWSRVNYVDHSVTDQSSILRFIEDNWKLGRLGNGSTDAKAGSLMSMFRFSDAHHGYGHGYGHGERGENRLILNPQTGEPERRNHF